MVIDFLSEMRPLIYGPQVTNWMGIGLMRGSFLGVV